MTAVKKPFRIILRNCWGDHVANIVTHISGTGMIENFKLVSPTRQDIVNWVAACFESDTNNTKFIFSMWHYNK